MNLEELTQKGLDELTSELESIGAEKETLTSDKEGLTAELETKATYITTLEQVAAERVSELDTLKQAASESADVLSNVNTSLAQAVSAYKSAVAQANPAVPGELLTGDTIEAINQSLESAKTLVSKGKETIEADIAAGKVPAGAPARTAPDVEALSPREKIQYAITKGGK